MIVLQLIFTAYSMYRSTALIKKTYSESLQLGEKNQKVIKMFVAGDSLAAGVGASSFENTIAGRVAMELASNRRVEFISEATVGTKMVNLLENNMPSEKQDLILLIVSSNDLFRFTPLDKFENASREVLGEYSKLSDRVILVGPGRVYAADAVPFFLRPIYRFRANNYVAILKAESAKFKNIIYVNPVEAEFNKKKYGTRTLASDNFHPNDEGQKFWFDLIKPHL